MTDYKAIFEAVEASLYANSADPNAFRQQLEDFKHFEGREWDDEDFYEITQVVVFASNMKTKTMAKYHPGVRKHFPSIEKAASYTDTDVDRITNSGEVIGFRRKVAACVHNARAIQRLVKKHGSMRAYVDSFAPLDDMNNLLRLRSDLIKHFSYVKDVTSFHLMTDLGLPVLKPDRVIMRIFKRLGLLYDGSQIFRAIELGQEFAEATGHPIRYIDIVLVSYGQVESWGNKGICLEKNPKCHLCGVRDYCQFYAR